tara:strand:- start:44313 stop:45239 length:927 start_codon:yes stop_codon:yes gene_type:complete
MCKSAKLPILMITMMMTQNVSAEPISINFDDIPLGTHLIDGQFGWYDWDTGFSSGFSVVMSDAGSPAGGGTGASGYVSTGPDSIQSVFQGSDTVTLEWDVELRGIGPSNGRGPDILICRDLDGDGVLENADQSPADDGFEGLVDFRVDYDKMRIRYFEHNKFGVRTQSVRDMYINFDTSEVDMHCLVQLSRVSSHQIGLEIMLSGRFGIIVEEKVNIEFLGPHLWDEIDGVVFRTDNCCSTADKIVFTPELAPCLADLTGDGELDFFDLSGFIVLFQLRDPIADFNGDSQFNFFDVSSFLSAFANGCP